MAAARLRLDQVWWIVSPGNPLKAWSPRPFADRFAAAEALGRGPGIRVTAIEEHLGSPYSFETIRFLKARLPGMKFVWIVGSDVFATFHLWRNWRDIALPFRSRSSTGRARPWRRQPLPWPAFSAVTACPKPRRPACPICLRRPMSSFTGRAMRIHRPPCAPCVQTPGLESFIVPRLSWVCRDAASRIRGTGRIGRPSSGP
jgi:nicotinate-nucleotide adenylyltransferase